MFQWLIGPYAWWRKRKKDITFVISPSSKYTLWIYRYRTKRNYGDRSLCEIRVNNKKLMTIPRNYHHFPFTFVEDHPITHHDYLICGEDYQGYTIVDLTIGEKANFLPQSAKQGWGFCWTDHQFDRENNILHVEGCYWACPYEQVEYDFSDPMRLPLPELSRRYEEEQNESS